jgi:hypothetical protein
MAQIELRHATIRLVDGYSNTAAVNDTPVNGMSTMLIDTLGVQEQIALGSRFTIVGDSLRHYVTAENHDEVQRITVAGASSGHITLGFTGTVAAPISVQTTANILFNDSAVNVQSALEALAAIVPGDVVVTLVSTGVWDIRFTGATYGGKNINLLAANNVDLDAGTVTPSTVNPGGSTRQITFTPIIMTASGIPSDDAVITFSGRTLEIKIGTGNLTYDEKRTMDYTLNRGDLDTVREGDQVPMDVKFDFIWEFLTAPGTDLTPTIEDVLKKRGVAANWTSSSADPCEPYAVDIEIEYDPPCGGVQEEIIVLPDFRQESLAHDIKAATVAATGKCNATQAVDSRS